MKKHLLLALCFAITSFSFGQLKVLVPGANQPLNNGDTVSVFGNATDEMNINLYVINTGTKMTVLARRDSLLLPMKDTNNTFCWGGFCYSQFTDVSTLSETLNHGDTANGISEFTGHYSPYGHLGAAYLKYTFYDHNGPGPTEGWVVVKYDATPAAVQNISNGNIRLATPYPNPANSFVTVNYSLNNGVQTANLKIFNLLGKCVETYPLSSLQTKTNIDVQSMPSGIYICEMQAQGCQPVYQKMVVSH